MTRETDVPPARGIWGAVLLLTLVNMVNVIDRFLPSILIEPIKRDLNLSDTAIGLINGFGFLVVYAFVGIALARVADRGRYGTVIAACLGLWSVMTVLGSFAQSGWQLALSRMGVAIGEAGNSPAAHAFISRNFAPERRGAPLALLTLSVPLASLVGFMGGGLLGSALGWRWTFAVMGGLGMILAPIVLLVLGRFSQAPIETARTAPRTSIKVLLTKPSFLLILAASSCVGIGAYALTTFGPAFLMRVHGMSLKEIGIEYSLVVGGAGIASLLVTGFLADRLTARDARWGLWYVALMIALIVPCLLAILLAESRYLALGAVALGNVVSTAYMVPVVASIHRLAPPDLRATASSLLLFSTAVLGGLGPLATGWISDSLQAELGPRAVASALMLVPAAFTLAAVLYALASVPFRKDAASD